ncbi:hypothetical protein ACEWY4_018639 [Coilia grayii]|uniref:Uncharacterized protein n=1 Tax=Coilia grayii TaxID=363190 RepID=A0ABD1JE12_9TELE
MDQNNDVQSCGPTELLSTAKNIVDGVITQSVIIYKSGQHGLPNKDAENKPRGSILRKDSTDSERTSPAHKITWAADLSDGSDQSWNQSSRGSADSFPFAIHPRCEDLIREDRQTFSVVHPYKRHGRVADRFVRTPSPLSAAPASRSPTPEEMHSLKNQPASVSEVSTLEANNIYEPRCSFLMSLVLRPFMRAQVGH